ncbi:RIBOSOMAL PROTEIN L7AE FAMILY MEMBER [Salix viminalis]|uniref:RIBOSOMAL PROTEIN L7AE FAMILY MEMBER n=1 Tax=Salix viminalis TaxID=40686 RepID=A0A6N2KR22_SALVM|nr:RIBOSOMAL PROTEIN L7AE FAMILY MEMBER [Salix viminalis]KAJ6672106.1 RIBOSOMAL PROTEIN L7AE FAMILY MEMBER [Salix viminalis]
MAALPPPSGFSPEFVDKAVKALLKWRSSKLNTQKPQLLEHDEFVYLILALKKIPHKGVSRINAHKIPLPYPLTNPLTEAPELCLIIDDRPKSGLNKDAAKKKIQNDNIPISKIIKISKLKTDYRPFEAKRKLCDSYDMFFADKRVVPLLPKMLGKQFFKKKKIPMTVDLKHSNWKEQIDKACGSALLFLRTGTCSVIKVGRVSMSREEISKNVMAAINGIAEIVPRKWGGIRSFHLKLLDSLALPVYQAVPDLKLKIDGGAKEQEEVEEEEENKVKEGEVGKKKGRIHEVRYMDNNDDNEGGQVVDEGELGSGFEGGIDNHAAADVENGSDELLKKKRKMGDNKGKGEKNVAKLKKEDGFKQKKANNEDVTVQKKLKKNALALESGEMQVKHNKKKKRLAA